MPIDLPFHHLTPNLPEHYALMNCVLVKPGQNDAEAQHLEIKKNKIVAISSDKKNIDSGIKKFDCSHLMVCPGFINSHTHAVMGFFRDYGHGKPEMIENFLFPAEKALTPDLIEPLSYSYLIAALKTGTTLISDHYYMVEGVGMACEKIGLKAFLGETIADIGGAFPGQATYENAISQMKKWNFSDNIKPLMAPHATDTVSDDAAQKIVRYAEKHELPIHMHLSQTTGERRRTQSRTGLSPVKWAEKMGLLSKNTLAVHLISADTEDLDILLKTNSQAVICPSSQIIYETLAPISKIKESGIPVSVATDCAASNDRADLREEARFCALVEKLTRSPSSPNIDHEAWVESITKTPASALGIGESTGEIAAGKSADLSFFQKSIDTLPLSKPCENLLFSQSCANIKHVLINGRFVLYDGECTLIDEEKWKASYMEAVKEIRQKAGI